MGDRFTNIENIEGSQFNDMLTDDVISVLAGNDTLYGLDGDNKLYSGDGGYYIPLRCYDGY